MGDEAAKPGSIAAQALAQPVEPLTLLRKIVRMTQEPPRCNALKLYLAAKRLHGEDRWSHLEVFFHEPLKLWALRGEHFSETFDTCRTEVVVTLSTHDTLTVARHEKLAQQLGLSTIFYALVDADGDV